MRVLIATALGVLVVAGPAQATLYSGSATAYSTCDGSTTQTASGHTVRVGYVANNQLALGTWIEMRSPRLVMGRRYFRVMDRGGPGFVLDFWTPDCAWMNSWGRRYVTFRALTSRDLYRGKPIGGWRVISARRGGKLVWRPR